MKASVVLLLAVLLAGYLERESTEAEQAQYCAMVAAYRAGSKIGWPDYRGTFDKECRK